MSKNETEERARQKLADQTIISFLMLVNRMAKDRKTPVSFGKGLSLTSVEAEICSIIFMDEGTSATELTKIMGVTRSAVSQTIVKLVEKGFVKQVTTADNQKLKQLHLTNRGKRAAEGVNRYRAQLMDEVFNVSERELKSYNRFMQKLERFQNKVRSN